MNYKGHFRDNEMNNEGTLFMSDGRIWSGLFDCSESFSIGKAQCKTQDKFFAG